MMVTLRRWQGCWPSKAEGLAPSTAAAVPCDVTENDALWEAAVEGRALVVELLLLEGIRPRVAGLRRSAPRSISQAVRWEASTPLEEPDDAAVRFMVDTLGSERRRWYWT